MRGDREMVAQAAAEVRIVEREIVDHQRHALEVVHAALAELEDAPLIAHMLDDGDFQRMVLAVGAHRLRVAADARLHHALQPVTLHQLDQPGGDLVVRIHRDQLAHELEQDAGLVHVGHHQRRQKLGFLGLDRERALAGDHVLGDEQFAQQFLGLERLDDEVLAARVVASDAFLDRVMARNEGHRNAAQRRIVLDSAAQRVTVHAGEVDVKQEEVWLLAFEQHETVLGARESLHLAIRLQNRVHDVEDDRVVIHHINLERCAHVPLVT